MLSDRRKDKWLDTAVSGIKFYLDRQRVRQELEDHFEDRMAALRRAFPDIPEEEAQTRTLAGLGDAEEVKRELAKVHRPWLGWLWNASRWAVWLLWMVCLFVGMGDHANTVERSLQGGMAGRTVYHRIRDGEEARLGGYTFRITGAAYVDRPEEYGAEDSLQLTLRVSTPRFWERIDSDTVLLGLKAAGPDGEWHFMAGQTVLRYTVSDELGNNTTERYCVLAGGELARWGLGWKEFSLYVPAESWQSGDQAVLSFESGLGGFTLAAPVTEKVVVP